MPFEEIAEAEPIKKFLPRRWDDVLLKIRQTIQREEDVYITHLQYLTACSPFPFSYCRNPSRLWMRLPAGPHG